MEPEIIKKIRVIAEQKVAADDDEFLVCDYAGGNIDDAYELGINAGEAWLARDLLKMWEDEKKKMKELMEKTFGQDHQQ